VKSSNPSIKITTTFQYESLSDTLDGNEKWAELDLFDMDVVYITTYPSPWFSSPSSIPSNYYSRINEYTSKPIIVAESGWPSAGSSNYHGSETKKKEFVELFPTLMNDVT